MADQTEVDFGVMDEHFDLDENLVHHEAVRMGRLDCSWEAKTQIISDNNTPISQRKFILVIIQNVVISFSH